MVNPNEYWLLIGQNLSILTSDWLTGGRNNDSGVASPSEEGESGDKVTQVKQTKSRTSSGEDAGIGGSEQGELRIFLACLGILCHSEAIIMGSLVPLSFKTSTFSSIALLFY